MTNNPHTRGALFTSLRHHTVVLAVIGLLVVVGWVFLAGGNRRSSVSVIDARLRAPDLLTLNVSTCHGKPEVVLLEETDVDVQVMVGSSAFPFRGGGDDCSDGVGIQLQEPLGDRAVIDMHAGKTLDVRRGVRVLVARVLPERVISFKVDSCDREPQLALLQETDSEVQVMVVARSEPLGPGAECKDVVKTRLAQPWNRRTIVDVHTGQAVMVEVRDY